MQIRGGHVLQRRQPAAGPQHYQTFSMRAPLATHWRPASCEEYECADYLKGFVLTVDLNTELGQRQAYYVRHDTSRRMHEQDVGAGLRKFVYGPGNTCFKYNEHRVPIGKPPLLLVVGGDWRGNPRNFVRRHASKEDWIDDFANHQDKLATIAKRG
jgi:hypothetical protein